MIRDTITEIERKVEAGSLDPNTRRELLQLLEELDQEIAELSRTHRDDARKIAGLTEASAAEAARPERNPEVLQEAADKLRASVEGFENTHPRLVEAINRIATTLAGLGI